jgi:hypothetical protein
MADNKEGANKGIKLIDLNNDLKGMQLRVRAYAKTKAKGTTMTVTSSDTQILFHKLCKREGVCK